jgi:hypothetical protein
MLYHVMNVLVAAFILWIPAYCILLIVQGLASRPCRGDRRRREEQEILEWNNRRLKRMHRYNRAYREQRRRA